MIVTSCTRTSIETESGIIVACETEGYMDGDGSTDCVDPFVDPFAEESTTDIL